jgi:hypothetical protein
MRSDAYTDSTDSSNRFDEFPRDEFWPDGLLYVLTHEEEAVVVRIDSASWSAQATAVFTKA